MIELILIVVLIVLFVYALVYIFIPSMFLMAGVALIIGIFIAIKNYFAAIISELDFVSWEWEKEKEPAKRSYFFGPGIIQLKSTIRKMFELNTEGEQIKNTAEKIKGDSDSLIIGIARTILGFIYKIFSFISIYIVGTFLCGILGLVHGTLTVSIMIISYIVFTFVWIVDRCYLLIKEISSECPSCKNRFIVPAFQCPNCGAIHKKLVPGPYGIWRHRCNCGKKLPSTFLNGRSKLKSFCPLCGVPLVASDAKQVCFQLLGGTRSGKSVYLSAFFHEFFERIENNSMISCKVTDEYRPYFEELIDWYDGLEAPSTKQLNAQMYPLLIDCNIGVKIQFSIYDVAGEKFDQIESEGVLPPYCNGYLFLIDPFSDGFLREEREKEGDALSTHSEKKASDIAINFINYLIHIGIVKVNSVSEKPIAVMIAKADVKEVKREIGPVKMNAEYKKEKTKFPDKKYSEFRDERCKRFLQDIGMNNFVETLELQFKNIHYFPVSSIGHEQNGTSYEPWGVLEPMKWLLPLADERFAEAVFQDINN